MKSYTSWLLLLFALSFFQSCNNQETVSLETLLNEITNREVKAEYPSPYFTCKQFSSYDRATVTPNDKSWFANWDRSMFIRIDTIKGNNEYVMMDTDGPGAIVRFWMTFGGKNTGLGTLRIYLDNNSEPVIEGNPFDVLSRGKLVGAPLSSSVSDTTKFAMRGHNLYLPIPYAKHCKVTYESANIKDPGAKKGGEAVYYNIDYRTYEKGTKVLTYSASELEKCSESLKIALQKLETRQADLPENSRETIFDGRIEKGKTKEISVSGENEAIRLIALKLKSIHPEQALRSTILEISFDGKTTVRCPVGDFFGAGYQIRFTNTYYTKVSNDSLLSCLWVMPYKKECRIKLENKGSQDVEITGSKIISAPYQWDSRTMYFSAAWKQYTHLATGEMKSQEGDGEPFDLQYLNLKGKGVYMGDGICVFNTVYAWWGEGDEKIYVDNESFPSFIGTGTEDYYGYAWCRPEKFSNHPFIAQPDGSGNFVPGYTVNIRQRGLDGIPFSQALRFDMEMWHWTRSFINFSHVNYWYILPDDAIEAPSDLKDATEPVALKREDIISPKLTNKQIEAENLILKSSTGGDFYYDNDVRAGWSGNVQMVWDGAKPTDKLTLTFTSDEEKTSDVKVIYSKGKEYGNFKIAINKSGDIRISANQIQSEIGQILIKNVPVLKGENTIAITTPSGNTNKKAHLGIDYFEFN